MFSRPPMRVSHPTPEGHTIQGGSDFNHEEMQSEDPGDKGVRT